MYNMATKQLMALAVLAVLLGLSSSAPKPDNYTIPIEGRNRRSPKLSNYTIAIDGRKRRSLNIQQYNNYYPGDGDDLPIIINNFLNNGVPSGAQLYNATQYTQFLNAQPQLLPIMGRLPDNATLIRPDIVDNFRCSGSEFGPNGYRSYGYYADTDNGCQIFHVCLPLQQLYPENYTTPITYQLSFICPEYKTFTQDALVCAWSNEAIPCENAKELYSVNEYFFIEDPGMGIDGEAIYGQKL